MQSDGIVAPSAEKLILALGPDGECTVDCYPRSEYGPSPMNQGTSSSAVSPANLVPAKPVPALDAANWNSPQDDNLLPPAGGGGYGAGGGGGGDLPGGLPALPGGSGFDPYGPEPKFNKGKGAFLAVGGLAVAGAIAFGVMAAKGESEKFDVKQIAGIRNELALMPKDQQLPKWREWAAKEDPAELRQDAFAQLAWAKDPQGLDLIIKGLESHDHRIRGTAAQALFEYAPGGGADKAKAALTKALAESNASDEPQIAWALTLVKDSSIFDRAFAVYSKGHFANLQRLDGSPAFDAEALVQLSSLDKLATMKGDPSPSVRQLVATALSNTGDAKWTQQLIDLVKDKEVEVAREAAVGLGKIANEAAMLPLLDALTRADKDSRPKFLEALRDGVGGKGLVLAIKSVAKEPASREAFQTKQLFDMMRELHDPRGGDALVAYIGSNPKPHWKTEAALRLAEVGDLRAVPILGWRLKQDPMKLYNNIENPEQRADDNERVFGARMLADLAILNPTKHAEIMKDAEDGLMEWITSKPQPHANGLRALVAAESKAVMPKLISWADPSKPLPTPGQQPPVPMEWETSQSALRYLGWTKEPRAWSILEKQITRQSGKKFDITEEGLKQGGLAVLGMTLHALGVGAADGFAQWGDPKAFPILVKYIEDKEGNEHARLEACFALSWCATDEQMKDVVKKVKDFSSNDPKVSLVRACYLETLIHKPVQSATSQMVDLLRAENDLEVRHQAARAIGIGGIPAASIASLQEKAKDKAIRSDAVLALLLGADADTAKRALAVYNDSTPDTMEELKTIYSRSFGYWSDKNFENGDVARWVENAQAAGRVKVHGALQDWPKQTLMNALSGDFDNGPRSMTRVQLRVRLMREAKGDDPKRRTQALMILKFMKERGVLMALRSEAGPWQEEARQSFFEVMNPKIAVEATTAPAATPPKK
jgi:HEAT repeat protein